MRRGFAIGVGAAALLVTGGVIGLLVAHNVSSSVFGGASTSTVEYANPYASPQQVMEGIYSADTTVTPITGYRVRGLILPHHLTASETIASGVRSVVGQHFKRILLLSPDHFNQCSTLLCTVDATYHTLFSPVRAWKPTVDVLKSSPLVTENQKLFMNEHGIYADLPFISHYFPGVPVTPLVLSQHLGWKANREQLFDLISRAVDDDTLFIVSSDFSHYLPLATANTMDEKTAETLFAKDLDGIASLNNPSQSDCPGCLWLMASLAEHRNFYNPSIILHTNSATILHDPAVSQTTSHFAIAWIANDELSPEDAAFAGDVTVTRASKTPTIPSSVRAWWSGSGIRVANLEGPLSETCAPRPQWYLFCNPLSLWNGLKDLATHWGVWNNHSIDRGVDGVSTTERLIQNAGKIALTSDGWSDGHVRLFALTEILNPVGQREQGQIAAQDASVRRALADKHSEELAVVFVHGGDEYQTLIDPSWEKHWEGYIDAGADAVIVMHSHMVSDVRIYHGKPIFRGIGNFIFDQWDRVPTFTAKLVRLRKEGESVRFETLTTRMK